MDKMKTVIPVSAIVATKDRAGVLQRMVETLLAQSEIPAELIIVDASVNDATELLAIGPFAGLGFKVLYLRASVMGAAVQRTQGIRASSQPYIWFLDDDIILEDHCTSRLWGGFRSRPDIGAVNAMITNQKYTSPGTVTRLMYWCMHGKRLHSYAGMVIGPAWNLLPEDDDRLPDYVEVEWLNTGCTMYNKAALPDPVFPDLFKGYSMLEDLTLSVRIAKTHRLLNARTARIYHDSQYGSYKSNVSEMARMELVNRHYVMTRVLNRTGVGSLLKLFVFECFGVASGLQSARGWSVIGKVVWGKLRGINDILFHRS